MATVLRYSAEELKTIRDYISGKRPAKLPDQTLIESIRRESPYLLPLVRLAEEKDLFDKLKKDPRVVRFSFVMFFPLLEGHLDSDLSEVRIVVSPTRTRGFAARVFVDGKDVVIKPIQSPDEPKIAKYAGEHGIGPCQYESLERYLTEEFLPGESFAGISSGVNSTNARVIGLRVAEILSALHEASFLFNDVIFDDDFGGSHLLVDATKGTKLIDFGVSIDLTAFPNLTDEQIYRILLTLPGIGGCIQSGMIDESELDARIGEMKEALKHKSVQQLLRRDTDFVKEGLGITSLRNGVAAQTIWQAFEEKYGS